MCIFKFFVCICMFNGKVCIKVICVFSSFLCVYMYVGSMGTCVYTCVYVYVFMVCIYMFIVMGYIGRYSQISTPPEHIKTAPDSIHHPIIMQTAQGLFQPFFPPVSLTKFCLVRSIRTTFP